MYATLFRSSNNGTATQATFNDSTSLLCGIVIVSLKASWIFLWIPWPSLPKIKTVELVQSISQYGFEGFFELLLKSLSELSKVGFNILSTSSHKKNSKNSPKPYWDIDWTKPTVLILGNEGQGVHKKIQEAFNETITIPHSELVESLNVACVAVPLLLERKRVAYTSNK